MSERRAEAQQGQRMSQAQGVAVVGSGVVALIAGSLYLSGASEPDDHTGAARVACHEQVRAQLKAPSTADFTDSAAGGGRAGPWTFSGGVDSENSFGAALRTGWSCRVSGDPETGWTFGPVTVQ